MGRVVMLDEYRQSKMKQKRETAERDKMEEMFREYALESEVWWNETFWNTIYDGYPYIPPGPPVVPGMQWHVHEARGNNFGAWVLDVSNGTTPETDGKEPTWCPFVRRARKPPFAPFNLASVEDRSFVVWYVDEMGYGQYGRVTPSGEIQLTYPRPDHWPG